MVISEYLIVHTAINTYGIAIIRASNESNLINKYDDDVGAAGSELCSHVIPASATQLFVSHITIVTVTLIQ